MKGYFCQTFEDMKYIWALNWNLWEQDDSWQSEEEQLEWESLLK